MMCLTVQLQVLYDYQCLAYPFSVPNCRISRCPSRILVSPRIHFSAASQHSTGSALKYRSQYECTDPDSFTSVRICTLFLPKLSSMRSTDFFICPPSVLEVHLGSFMGIIKPWHSLMAGGTSYGFLDIWRCRLCLSKWSNHSVDSWTAA
jgi:hypothetical protein